MSNQKQETVADIVKEMRQAEETWHKSEIAQLPTQYLKEWSDRIEAAHQREVAELRECLEQAYGDKIGTYTMKCNEVERWRKALREKGANND